MNWSSKNENLSCEESRNDLEGGFFSDVCDSEVLEFEDSDEPPQLLPGQHWNKIMLNVPDISLEHSAFINFRTFL